MFTVTWDLISYQDLTFDLIDLALVLFYMLPSIHKEYVVFLFNNIPPDSKVFNMQQSSLDSQVVVFLLFHINVGFCGDTYFKSTK